MSFRSFTSSPYGTRRVVMYILDFENAEQNFSGTLSSSILYSQLSSSPRVAIQFSPYTCIVATYTGSHDQFHYAHD